MWHSTLNIHIVLEKIWYSWPWAIENQKQFYLNMTLKSEFWYLYLTILQNASSISCLFFCDLSHLFFLIANYFLMTAKWVSCKSKFIWEGVCHVTNFVYHNTDFLKGFTPPRFCILQIYWICCVLFYIDIGDFFKLYLVVFHPLSGYTVIFSVTKHIVNEL